MTPIPRGAVTFLFSDVEGSTRLLESYPDEAGPALARHHELLAAAMQAHSGVIFETVGDAVYAAFQDAADAASAALAGQRALADHDWGPILRLRVRMALHTGEVESRGTHYFGAPLFRCARLQSLAYGDQTLLSEASASRIRAGLLSGTALRDLGWQRLKDLDEPEHVFQLDGDGLPSEFPPLRTLGETKHNLPAEFSSFVGRKESLDRLRERIAEAGVVVITGPGGVGKTRLAIHLAREALERFPDGVCFVELAPLSQASDCLAAVALALRLRETAGRSIEEVVKAYLADKRMLVILDNAEHLTDIRGPIRELARSAPTASFLVTSRTSVALPGAHHERLDPMPDESTATDGGPPGPAISLLADRVRALDQSFRLTPENTPLVAQICTRVDGLPLGLELVAPAVASVGARETLRSLERQAEPMFADEPSENRHASLQATVAWSYNLLDVAAREVFRQVSVFVGSFDIDAARAVCGSNPDETDRSLLALIGSSLLSPFEGVGDERRFSMLVTVQEFGRRMLTSDELAHADARHAEYFMKLAAEAAEELQGPNQGQWRSRITLELPNLRAALGWAERNTSDGPLEMVVNLAHFWDLSGLNAEGRMWLERSLNTFAGDPFVKARGLRFLGLLAEHHGELGSAARTYRHLRAIQRQMGDTSGLADTKRGLAGVVMTRGRHGEARRLLNEAIAVHRQDGDRRRVAAGLHQLALLELESGDPRLAIALAAEMEALYRQLGDTSGLAIAKHHYGRALRQTGSYEEAGVASSQALAMFEEAGNDGWLAPPLINLAWTELALGDTNRARSRICRALFLTRDIAEPQLMPRILEARAAVAAVDGDMELAHRIVQAANMLRHSDHLSRNRSDSRELRRYVKVATKPNHREEPTASQVDELVQELLEDCRSSN